MGKKGLICLLGLWGVLWAQPGDPAAQTDSLMRGFVQARTAAEQVRWLNELTWACSEFDSDLAYAYGMRAWELAEEHQLPLEMAFAIKALANAAYQNHEPDASICLHLLADSIYLAHNDSAGRLSVLNNLGLVYRATGQCELASRGYLEGMHMARALGEVRKEMILWLNYFESLISCFSYAHAVPVGDSLLAYTRRHDAPYLSAHVLSAQGFLSYRTGKDSLALVQLEEARQLAGAFGDQELTATIINNFGNVYLALDRYQEAYDAFAESLRIEQEIDVGLDRVNSYHNMGLALFYMGRHAESIPYFERTIQINQANGRRASLPDGYLALARAYARVGRHREAAQYFDHGIELKDTMFNEEMQREIAALSQKYETEKVARELAQTRLTMQQREGRFTTLLGFAIAGLVLAVGAALVVVLAMRRRRAEADKRRIELEYQVLRAQMNPHFIFNALNSIQGFFSDHDFAQGNEYLGAFGQLMRRVLEQSRQPSIALAEELETLDLYLQLEQVRLRDKFHYRIDLNDDLDASMIYIPPLILQPFVENAIWHGIAPQDRPGSIHISCTLPPDSDDCLLVEIVDDGIGRQASAQRSSHRHGRSMGIDIIRERLGAAGRVLIEDRYDAQGRPAGTRVSLHIPLTDD